jgi:hypothetical protein
VLLISPEKLSVGALKKAADERLRQRNPLMNGYVKETR